MGRRTRQAARGVLSALALLSLVACPPKSGGEKVTGPATPTPSAEDGGIDPSAEKQVAAIAAAMNAYGPAIHTCWSVAAADDFRLSGVVLIRLDLGVQGAVKEVHVDHDEPADKVLTECLVALWRRVTWPDVFSAGDSIRLPPMSFVAPERQYVVSSAHAVSYPMAGSADSHATILLDYKNSGNRGAAMTALTMAPGFSVPLHKHASTEVLYILKGTGEIHSSAKRPTRVDRGSAVFIPADAPHSFRVTSSEPVVAIQIYVPGGAEQRFKGIDVGATTPVARAGRHDPAIAVRRHSEVVTLPIAGGGVSLLFDVDSAPNGSASVAGMSLEPKASVATHRHPASTEMLFVLEGGGTLTVAGDSREVGRFDAIQIPPGVEHSFTVGLETTKVVQFYTPAGPEQRFKSR